MLNYNWKGVFINGHEIIEPIDANLTKSQDKWKVRCKLCKRIWNATPNSLRKTNSCGCTRLGKDNSPSKKKYNYYNFIHEITKIKILKPVNSEENKSKDFWICLCPHHDPPIEFIALANNVVTGKTTSCGCIRDKKSSKRRIEYNKKCRNSKGLKDDQSVINEFKLIRLMLVKPIIQLIFRIDNFKCKKCGLHTYLNAHHIIAIFSTNFNDKKSLQLTYDLNNIISLCKDCHEEAHNYCTSNIDPIIQKELQEIANNRIIPQNLLDEYNKIVEIKIESWLNKYLTNKNKSGENNEQ